MAGGHCAFNPEPLADFVDAFVLGDGEEVVGEINEVMADWLAAAPPEAARPRRRCCTRWPALEGVYVPALYDADLRRRPAVSTAARRPPGCRPR